VLNSDKQVNYLLNAAGGCGISVNHTRCEIRPATVIVGFPSELLDSDEPISQ